MNPADCKHIRLKDVECGMDVEKFIASIENQYHVDFKTLPQWKELVKKINFVKTYCDRKIHDVNTRKSLIIKRLYIESARQSPFELTDKLIRTADVWLKSQWTNQQKDKRKHDFKTSEGPAPSFETSDKSSKSTDSALSRISALPEESIIEDFERNIEKEDNIRNAPVNALSNQHKLLSPLGTQYSDLSYHSMPPIELNEKSESSAMICQNLNFQLIKCCPKEIVISSNSSEEQRIEFSLQNISTYSCSVIFNNVRNRGTFKKAKVFPYLTVKLCPGLSCVFKFVFDLIRTKVDFKTNIFFRVYYKDSKETLVTEFCIPISTQFIEPLYIEIPKTITIPPVYKWQLYINSKYPSGVLTIELKSGNECYVRIIKIKKELSRGTSFRSDDAIAPNTESVIYRNEDSESFNEVNTWSSKSSVGNEYEDISDDNFILLLIKDIIEISLESFVFDMTWLYLPPKSKRKIPVHFTKSEYTGYHQSYYDVEFRKTDTYELLDTKVVKIFAEILPHPLLFCPAILDMGSSPIIHGVCMDHFVITNMHKVYSSIIKIEILPIAKQLISITPMKDVILPQSTIKFNVRICSSEFTLENKFEDMVHFTIKIVATGDKLVYQNIPPIYYEIIAPCASEFGKIVNSNENII